MTTTITRVRESDNKKFENTRISPYTIITLNTKFFGYDDVYEVIMYVVEGNIYGSFIKVNGKATASSEIFSDDRYVLFKVLERELSSELKNFEAWFSPLKKEVI